MLVLLDLPTLLTVLWLVMLLMALTMGAMWLRQRDAALGIFALGFLACTVGSGLGALYQVTPPWSWATLGNAALLTGEALFWAGLRRFDGRPTPPLLILALPAAYILAGFANEFWIYQPARGAVFSTAIAVLALGAAYQLNAGRRAEPLPARLPLACLFAAFGLLHGGRAVVASLELGTYSLVAAIFLLQIFNVFAFALGLFALIKERAEHALRHAAHTDQLTGIANRRSFFRLAQERIEGAVLLIDLDHFKRINDRFGHAVGDDVLVRFAALLSARLGPADVFARLGGEEFGLFLPGCSEEAATATAERLRRAVAGLRIETGGAAVPVRISVGVAATEGAAKPLETLLAAADAALYRAKEAGRNRVVCFNNDVPAGSAPPQAAAA